MSECRDIVMQEQLPEYLHGALTSEDHGAIEAHLNVCSDCSEQLELLRTARQTLSARTVPQIRIASIVAALPRPETVQRGRRQRSLVSPWRMAAALTVIVLGGLSLPTLRTYVNGGSVLPDSLISDSSAQIAVEAGAPRGVMAPTAGNGSSLSDLEDEDLEMLIGSMESLESVPLAEPDAAARRFGVTEGGN